MYKSIIFDFNGTLIDDCDVCLKILNMLLSEYHLPFVSKEKYLDIFTFPVYKYYEVVGFDVSKESFKIIANKFHEYYNHLSYKEVKLFDSVIPILNYLKGKVNLVCLSASLNETLKKQLDFYKISSYFDNIIGVFDNLGSSKLSVGLDYLNHSNFKGNEVLFIGDSIHDLEVASAMGVDCYLVATGHTSKERLLKASKNVIDSLSEIKDILKKTGN